MGMFASMMAIMRRDRLVWGRRLRSFRLGADLIGRLIQEFNDVFTTNTRINIYTIIYGSVTIHSWYQCQRLVCVCRSRVALGQL